MLITVKKEVEETIEVNAPCWLRDKYSDKLTHITSDGGIVIINKGLVALFEAGESFTNENIHQAISAGVPTTELEFRNAMMDAWAKIQNALTANGALA
jgi:hypothetical protein